MKVRTFEFVQNVSGYLECESMDDLSNSMQDAIYAALDRKAHEVGLPLTITGVRCGVDPDPDTPSEKFYLHIHASEIVVADSRALEAERRLLEQAIAEIKN